MNTDAEGFDEEAPEVFDFLDEYLTDLEHGKAHPLAHYLRRYPGHEEAISREYLARQDGLAREARDPGGEPRGEVGSPEQHIGPYRLVSEIGRGGQGVVYLAEDLRIERQVALKLLPPAALFLSEDRKRRMRREAEVVSRLDHPGICGIFDAEISGEVAYIAMPFIEGQTLGAAIAFARDWPEEKTPENYDLKLAPKSERELFALLAFFEEAARALHAAHEAGIVHRDIKPGNLMVTPEGRAVWLDFGQARDTESTAVQLTVSGEVFGTPAYMSPEQIAGGSERVDARTDVWSLTVSLFEALTLERPFEGASTHALLFAIQTEEPRSARALNRTVTEELDVVLQTGLERDLGRRYASALELAEELARLRRYEPIHARPASTALRVRRLARRHPLLFTSVSMVVLTLTAGLAWTLHMLAREQQALDYAVGRHLAERAVALLDEDPAASLALSIEAVERAPTYLTRSALYEALDACYLVRELDGFPARRFRDLDMPAGDDTVAAALSDGTGRIYDVNTGAELARWQAHEGEGVEAVTVACEGRWVVTGGSDGRVCVYDREAGRIATSFDGPGGEVRALCLDSCHLIVRGSEGAPAMYTLPEGELLGPLPGASGTGGRYVREPIGEGFFELPERGATLPTLACWYVHPETATLVGPDRPAEGEIGVTAADVLINNRLWAGGDEKLHTWADQGSAWDVDPFAPLELGGTGELVVAHPRRWGLVFVAVRRGERVQGHLADLYAGELVPLGEPGAEPIVDAKFSPGGRSLATVTGDGVVHLWDVATAGELAAFRGYIPPAEVLWARDGYLVTRGNSPTAHVWYGKPRPDVYRLHSGSTVREAFFAPDGERALTLSADGAARLWSTPSAPTEGVATGALLAFRAGDGSALRGAAFDERGARVLLWGEGGVALWNPVTAADEHAFPADGPRMSAAFQPGGTRILVVGESRGAWSVDGETWQGEVRYGGAIATSLAKFSPDGRAVATTHADGTLRLWNATSGELLWERAHENPKQEVVTLVDLAFSPDGKALAVARDDRRVRFHDVRTGDSARADLSVFPPRDLCWSPDGRRILITGPIGRGAFRVEELVTGESTLKHIFHSGDITGGAFSPDGALMLTSSKDGTIFVREVADSNPVSHLKGDGGVALGAAFSPGPGPLRVIGAFEDGTARVWPVDPLPGAIARKPRELQDWEQARETRLAKPLDYP